jgi:hypothetical protein
VVVLPLSVLTLAVAAAAKAASVLIMPH